MVYTAAFKQGSSNSGDLNYYNQYRKPLDMAFSEGLPCSFVHLPQTNAGPKAVVQVICHVQRCNGAGLVCHQPDHGRSFRPVVQIVWVSVDALLFYSIVSE